MDESWATRRTRRILNQPDVTIYRQRELNDFLGALSDNSRTNRLSIQRCSIYVDTANALSVALAKMSELRTFELDWCYFDTRGMEILASSLAEKGSITSLKFSRCDIIHEEMEAIVDAYMNNGSLQVLNFWDSGINADDMVSLALLLTNNSSIKTLGVKISNNDPTTAMLLEGITALARAVAAHQTLECLHINGMDTEEKLQETRPAFEKVIYDNESMETVISNSNHTLKALHFYDDTYEHSACSTKSLMGLNKDGPEKAMQRKIARFLNEHPFYVVSMDIGKNLTPLVLDKVGRICRLNTMFELVRSMPDLFEAHALSRKRPRP